MSTEVLYLRLICAQIIWKVYFDWKKSERHKTFTNQLHDVDLDVGVCAHPIKYDHVSATSSDVVNT